MKAFIVFFLGFLGLAALADAQPAPSGPRFQVDRSAGPYPLVFAVAAGPPGGFTVAWKASDGLRVGRFDPAGDPPGRGILIRRPGPEIWDVQLAVGEKSGLIVWSESLDDERTGLFGRRLDALGRPVGNVLRLDAGKRASAGVARVVVDRAGDFVIAWDETTESSTYSLHVRRLGASGSLGPEVRLPTFESHRYRAVSSLLCDRFGGLLLVGSAQEDDSPWNQLFFLRLGADLRPRGREVRVVPDFEGDVEDLTAALGADGGLLVVWSLYTGSSTPPAIFRRRFTAAGDPAEAVVRLVDAGIEPSVAADPGGGFLFAWRTWEIDGTDSRILARRIEPSGDLGPRFPIDPQAVEAGLTGPRLAATGRGRFAAVWNSGAWERALVGQRFASPPVGRLELRLGRITVPEGGGEAVLDVVRREGSRGAVSVEWEVRGRDAVPGEDLIAASGTVAFADGDSLPKRIAVPILNDSQPENDETFQVVLRDPGGGAGLGAHAQATVEIRDDDLPSPLLAGAGPVFLVASHGDSGGSALCCPRVARLDSGGFVVAWLDFYSRGYHAPDKALFFHLYTAAGELLAAREAAFGAFSPEILPRPGGGFLLLWQDDPDPDYEDPPNHCLGQRYDGNGNPLGAALAFPSLDDLPFRLAPAPDAGFVAVVPRLDGATYDLMVERYDAEGRRLGEPAALNETPIPADFGEPSPFELTAGAAGDFLAVWERRPGPGAVGGLFARRFSATGVPLGKERAISAGTVARDPVLTALPAAAGGVYAVAWQGEDGDGWGVWVRWLDAYGAPLGGASQAADSAAGDQTQPAIAAGPAGDVLVSWRSASRIHAQLFAAPGKRSGAQLLLDPDGDADQSSPVLAITESGYVAAWIGSTGERFGVRNLRARRLGRP